MMMGLSCGVSPKHFRQERSMQDKCQCKVCGGLSGLKMAICLQKKPHINATDLVYQYQWHQ